MKEQFTKAEIIRAMEQEAVGTNARRYVMERLDKNSIPPVTTIKLCALDLIMALDRNTMATDDDLKGTWQDLKNHWAHFQGMMKLYIEEGES